MTDHDVQVRSANILAVGCLLSVMALIYGGIGVVIGWVLRGL